MAYYCRYILYQVHGYAPPPQNNSQLGRRFYIYIVEIQYCSPYQQNRTRPIANGQNTKVYHREALRIRLLESRSLLHAQHRHGNSQNTSKVIKRWGPQGPKVHHTNTMGAFKGTETQAVT